MLLTEEIQKKIMEEDNFISLVRDTTFKYFLKNTLNKLSIRKPSMIYQNIF